jgi:hypothetical protein
MMRPITPAQVALCAVVRLYLDGDDGDVSDDEMAQLGTPLLRVLQAEGASEGGANPELRSDATLVDVLALLQVLAIPLIIYRMYHMYSIDTKQSLLYVTLRA